VTGVQTVQTPTGQTLTGRDRTPVPLGSPLARLMLDRARMRSGLPVDMITFVAPCPGCGQDCDWTQSRDDTRVRSVLACPC
jgi:hypothetical protein